MRPKISLVLSALILTSLTVPPIMGMGPEKEQGNYQLMQLPGREELRKEISAFRRNQREEYQAAKNAAISFRKEYRKEISAFRMSRREAG